MQIASRSLNVRPGTIAYHILLFLALLHAAPAQVRPAADPNANLPAQRIGANDLVAVSVYDAPELTRTVRVGADGFMRLPMLKRKIKAEGLMPGELETGIAAALVAEQLIVDPFVTITIAEYNSRPISVAGAVRQPVTFQASGPVTLLEAVNKAGGLAPEAGPEILVSRAQSAPDDNVVEDFGVDMAGDLSAGVACDFGGAIASAASPDAATR